MAFHINLPSNGLKLSAVPGPGRRTALSALAALPQLAQQLALPPVDAARVVVAGHSMGGHGAWRLGKTWARRGKLVDVQGISR